MAELTIRLVLDPQTGKKNVVIDYQSDSDSLPMEHEEDHRALVDKLIEGGALSAADVGTIIVVRDEPQAQATDEQRAEAQSERPALSEDQ